MYDADPPFAPKSAISYAWSVGAVLELYRLMERFDPAWRKKREKAAPKNRLPPSGRCGETPHGDGGGGRACGFRTERGGGRRGETRETPQSPGQRERKAQNRT